MTQKQIDDFAKQTPDNDCAEFFTEYKGIDIYECKNSKQHDMLYTGYPSYILVKDKKMRFATYQEDRKILLGDFSILDNATEF